MKKVTALLFVFLFFFSCSNEETLPQNENLLFAGSSEDSEYRLFAPELIETGRQFYLRMEIEGEKNREIEEIRWEGDSSEFRWDGPVPEKGKQIFTCFLVLNQPGAYTLPNIEIISEEDFIFQSLSGELILDATSSLVEGQTELFGYLPEKEIPDYSWIWWIVIPLVFLSIIILIIVLRQRKKMFSLPPRSAEEKSLEQLEYLHRKKERLTENQFSLELGSLLRDYLDMEFDFSHHSKTAGEISEYWTVHEIFPEWFINPLREILEQEEKFRFSPEVNNTSGRSQGDYQFLRDFLEYRLKLKREENQDV